MNSARDAACTLGDRCDRVHRGGAMAGELEAYRRSSLVAQRVLVCVGILEIRKTSIILSPPYLLPVHWGLRLKQGSGKAEMGVPCEHVDVPREVKGRVEYSWLLGSLVQFPVAAATSSNVPPLESKHGERLLPAAVMFATR